MSKFGLYNIILKDLPDTVQVFEYDLNDEYFQKIDSPEVSKGSVKARVSVRRKTATFELLFKLEGVIRIPCDRCLDDMDQNIRHEETIEVKLGRTYSEENDIVVVPEEEGSINVAWFMYEFIVLNIPIKHVHAPGECNKTIVNKLKKHITRHKDDTEENGLFELDDEEDNTEEDTQVDPRWDNLQQINFDNN